MHPTIRQYWENKGVEITSLRLDFGNYCTRYYDASGPYDTIAMIYRDRKMGQWYWFDGKLYREEQAIKIVKLGAFL